MSATDSEQARLNELFSYRVLDTAPEDVFDRITALASRLFDTPMALVTLIDEHRQWFKSRVGVDLQETPREYAFCDHTIRGDGVMVVSDARADPRFRDNPLVTGPTGVRFYAGAPLKTRRGHRLGAMCVIDTKPREQLTVDASSTLEVLAELVVSELELRQALLVSGEQVDLLARLNNGILLIENADTLDSLPALAAEAVRDVMQASQARVSLELHAPGGEHASATAPPQQADEAGGPVLLAADVLGRLGTSAKLELLGSSHLDYGEPERHALQQFGHAVLNVAEHLSLLKETRLATEQLRRSQKLEAMGQLTGGLAHDFNNLLTVIIGNAEVICAPSVGDAQSREAAELILGAAQRGAELTQRLLAFTRQQPLEPKVLDAGQLLSGMAPLLRRTLGEQIRLELVMDPELWPSLIDPGQLEGVILNLCLNARDAMTGGGRLTIRTENLELDQAAASRIAELTPGKYVQISVSDTGCGIDPELIGRVFDPFFTTKEKGKGTGLGLSMVYGFMRQSGGAVTIDSEPDRGTTVTLLLPRATGAGQAAVTTPADTQWTGGSERVLVVEDEDMVRESVARQLRALGYHVVEASDGTQALEILRSRDDIDLLFTDVVMPGRLNGLMLAEEARQLHPGLKVLFTSGYTQNALIDHGRLEPGVQLLSKPYRRAELARKVREALG